MTDKGHTHSSTKQKPTTNAGKMYQALLKDGRDGIVRRLREMDQERANGSSNETTKK